MGANEQAGSYEGPDVVGEGLRLAAATDEDATLDVGVERPAGEVCAANQCDAVVDDDEFGMEECADGSVL